MISNLYYEHLVDRALWVDGESTFTKNGLYNCILSGKDVQGLKINELDSEIDKFIKFSGINLVEKTAPDYTKLDDNFLITEYYKSLELESFFIQCLSKHRTYVKMSKKKKLLAVERIYTELELYKSKSMEDVLKTAIYIVDTFKHNQVVWGPGRGSSCCSYLLFLIGLHDVDSMEFDLDINEFLR